MCCGWYSLFFNQRTTTPQFTPKIEPTTLHTFDLEGKKSHHIKIEVIIDFSHISSAAC
jgi:hypothetical protein